MSFAQSAPWDDESDIKAVLGFKPKLAPPTFFDRLQVVSRNENSGQTFINLAGHDSAFSTSKWRLSVVPVALNSQFKIENFATGTWVPRFTLGLDGALSSLLSVNATTLTDGTATLTGGVLSASRLKVTRQAFTQATWGDTFALGAVTAATCTTQPPTVALNPAYAGTATITVTGTFLVASTTPIVTLRAYTGTGWPHLALATIVDGTITLKLTNVHAADTLNSAVTFDIVLL